MLRSLVLAALAASLLALAPPVARACSCTEPPPPREALAAAAAVFEGQVLEIVEAGPMRVRVRFRVTQHWKGVESEELTLLTAPDSPACGVPFAVGESWLVYGDGSEGGLSASLCSRTVRMSEAGCHVLSEPLIPPCGDAELANAPLLWWERLLGAWSPHPIVEGMAGEMHCFGP